MKTRLTSFALVLICTLGISAYAKSLPRQEPGLLSAPISSGPSVPSSFTPVVSHNLWHSYESNDDFVYHHDFISSRDGQGFHWWIYLETTYILHEYGQEAGYDFTLDNWVAERIFPLDGGYYNAMISQKEHDVSMDLLFNPDLKKYVVLYARHEGGHRRAGVNEIPYTSQLIWEDFDFHENYGRVYLDNPFGDLCETSISQALSIFLSGYQEACGYSGKWRVRELFGRSPFFDYLVEYEEGFLWVCVDMGQHAYASVPFDHTAHNTGAS